MTACVPDTDAADAALARNAARCRALGSAGASLSPALSS